jgi:peptidoglycan lytic transglycosylase
MRRTCTWIVVCYALCSSASAGSWTGRASYYNYFKGHTASGTHFGAQTAAHKFLPYGTKLKVTNLRNGKATIVIVADRGPGRGRVIDVSAAAAESLAFKHQGTAFVKVETLSQ